MKIFLHPVRMRIIQAFVTGLELTVSDLMEYLPDIPQATVYRHLKKLYEAKIIKVTKETKIRGAMERVYTLAEDGASLSKEEMKKATKDEHFNMFLTFVSYLLGDYSRYLDQDQFDVFQDGVSFRKASVHLSQEEQKQLITEIGEVLAKYIHNKPAKHRREYHLSTIFIPEPKKK